MTDRVTASASEAISLLVHQGSLFSDKLTGRFHKWMLRYATPPSFNFCL